MDARKNFAFGTLASGIASGATSLSVGAGEGARFPAVSFNAVIWNRTDYISPAHAYHGGEAEIVRVTNIATDTLTITRAQEGTADVNHNTGGKTYEIWAGPTALYWQEAVIPNLEDGFEIFDDFSGDSVVSPWVAFTTGGTSASLAASESNHPGVFQLRTSTSATAFVGVYLSRSLLFMSGGEIRFKFIVRVPTLSTAGEEFNVWAGFGDTRDDVDQVDGVYFAYDRDGKGVNWFCVTAKASTRTETDSGVAVGTDWVVLEAVVNAAGTSVTFYIDGVAVATQTTNIPDTSSNVCGPMAGIEKSAGTTQRTLDVDAFWAKQLFTTPR